MPFTKRGDAEVKAVVDDEVRVPCKKCGAMIVQGKPCEACATSRSEDEQPEDD